MTSLRVGDISAEQKKTYQIYFQEIHKMRGFVKRIELYNQSNV